MLSYFKEWLTIFEVQRHEVVGKIFRRLPFVTVFWSTGRNFLKRTWTKHQIQRKKYFPYARLTKTIKFFSTPVNSVLLTWKLNQFNHSICTSERQIYHLQRDHKGYRLFPTNKFHNPYLQFVNVQVITGCTKYWSTVLYLNAPFVNH